MRKSVDFSALFEGELQQFPACPQSRALANSAREVVIQEFGEAPLAMKPDEFRAALAKARARIATAPFHHMAQRVLAAVGAPLDDLMLDQVRLRAVPPGLEKVEAAAPVFYAHRDTWYGNPKCQINGWIPLHAVSSDNSFRFYLDDFQRPVANDSADFRASEFQGLGGFGRVTADRVSVYPKATETTDGATWDVTLGPDQILLFSSSHLHQTLPNLTSEVRFSLDFRFFCRTHFEAGLGAPDPDNQCQGTVTGDYLPCSF